MVMLIRAMLALTLDEARRIASNIAKLPHLLGKEGASASVGPLARLLEFLQLGFGELPRAFDKLQPTHWGAMIVPQRQVPSE
jgi:hypothetical protein